jgi:hypothetical protein
MQNSALQIARSASSESTWRPRAQNNLTFAMCFDFLFRVTEGLI